MAPFLNLSTVHANCSRRRTRSFALRNYQEDEMLSAEALIVLSQGATANAAIAVIVQTEPLPKFPETEPSPNHPEVNINQTVQNNCSPDSPSGHKIDDQIGKSPAPDDGNLAQAATSQKLYQCDVCGECFLTGQSLGGHKRKHYFGVINGKAVGGKSGMNSSSSGTSGGASSSGAQSDGEVAPPRRGLDLDLNFPPPPEN